MATDRRFTRTIQVYVGKGSSLDDMAPSHYKSIIVEVEIDEDSIAWELGSKAFRNMGKKAIEMGGLVTCRVVAAK